MKKLLSVLMLAVMMMAFVGCGGKGDSDAPVVGDWKLATIEAMGQTMTVDEFAELSGSDDVKMEMSIKADGKFTASLGDISGEGTWEYKEPTLTLSSDGESMTGEYKDGKLTLQMEEAGQSYSMTFEK